MNSTQITCFLAAANSKSFTEAAEKVFMTQPTFGRHISSFEKELGFLLFVRGWKNFKITAAGKIFYDGLVKMTEDYLTLLDEAKSAAEGHRGILHIGLLEGQLMDDHLRRILKPFQASSPGVTIDLHRYTFRGMLEAIENYELDIGITLTFDVEHKKQFDYQPVYSLKNNIVLPRDHPLAAKPDLTLADLKDETFVELDYSDSDVVSRLMTQSCLNAGFQPKMVRQKDLRLQVFAVESGVGIAAFNEYHTTCNHPGLTHISIPDLPDIEMSAVWARNTMNPVTMRFVQSIRGK